MSFSAHTTKDAPTVEQSPKPPGWCRPLGLEEMSPGAGREARDNHGNCLNEQSIESDR